MSLNDLGILIGIIAVVGSFIYACLQVGLVAGKTDGRLSSLSDGLAALTQSLREFAGRADERLNDHGEKLADYHARIALLEQRRNRERAD